MQTNETRALEQLSQGEVGVDEALSGAGLDGDAGLRRAAAWSEAAARGVAARELRARRLAWRRGVVSAAVACTALGSLWFSRQAWAGTCASLLPAPLVTFCKNEPALADEVNGNFKALTDSIIAKTGSLVPSDITANNVAVRPANKLSFGATTRQMVDLYGTDYGLGVQGSTLYQRSGAAFAWYKAGTHSNTAFDPGAGGTTLATLNSSGDFMTGGVLGGASLRARSCTWVGTGANIGADYVMHTVQCPDGQYVNGWRCYASGSLDGDCAVRCCLP